MIQYGSVDGSARSLPLIYHDVLTGLALFICARINISQGLSISRDYRTSQRIGHFNSERACAVETPLHDFLFVTGLHIDAGQIFDTAIATICF